MFPIYRLIAECKRIAIHVLSTPDGRSLGTLETLLRFPQPIDALPYEIRTELAKKKLDSDAVGPSAVTQHQLQSCRQRTSHHEQRQLARGARQDQPQTLGRHSRCCPVLSCPKHSRRYGRGQQPKRETLEQTLSTIGAAVFKKSSPRSIQ